MQPVPPSYMAYDRAITVFSPDGRLLQVEYARQAVKKGSTSVGLRTESAIILAATKTTAPLAVDGSSKKIFQIDDHAAITTSGLLADARDLVEFGRVKSQINKITYGGPVSLSTLTKQIADRKHVVTQYAGVRPFGVGFLIGGVDETGPRLFETDPSGTIIEWYAQSIGRGSDKSKKVFEKDYKPKLKEEDGIRMAINALKAGEKDIDIKDIEVAVIKTNEFRRLSEEEIARLSKG
ncbi:MAG: archaeal proteasome endopeptidase complex subunit alpha [Candidatus Aenigmarchaeota archaeon]|nr:archaeal proteasome endopeptidase complex subunit alpha [Candidatus Aenigmarchaeota archaeon]